MSAPRDGVPRLPHGAPFLLLDRVLEVGEREGAFLKLVSAADPCVGRDGHLPAAFVLEALAQGAGALLAALELAGAAPGYLAAVDHFHVEVAIVRIFAGAILFRTRALVDGMLCAEGRLTLALPR